MAQNMLIGSIITVLLKLEKGSQNDWVCPNCKIPATISWHHETYTNTCTSDNILTILLLHCHQHGEFLSYIGSSDVEVALKSGLKLMLQSKIQRGKTVILDFLKQSLT